LIINVIWTKSVDNDNLPANTEVFEKLEQVKRRGNISYNLWLRNTGDYLKISADYSNCFNVSAFLKYVKKGDTLFVKFTEKEGLFRTGTVTSLSDTKSEYIDIVCINDKINKSKKRIPILAGIGILIFLIIILKKFGVRINY
jgi:hypothetical protein